MKALLCVAACGLLLPASAMAQRGGGGHGGGGGFHGGGGFSSGGGFHGGFSSGGGFRGVGGGAVGGFRGGSAGAVGGFRGSVGGYGGFRGTVGNYGGFRGTVGNYGGYRGFGGYGYRGNGYRGFGYGFGRGFYGGYYPWYGFGFGYGWPYDYGFDPYDYPYNAPAYTYYSYPSYSTPASYAPAYPPVQQNVYVSRGNGDYDQYGQPMSRPSYNAQGTYGSTTAGSSTNNADPQFYLIATRDHTIYAALSYSVSGSTMEFTTLDHEKKSVQVSQLDRDLTERLNRGRHVSFQVQ